MGPRRAPAAILAVTLCLAAGEARADAKRPTPDYDGRGDKPTTAGDVLLWVPRIVVSPLYLVSEFVLRRPFGWLITTAEKNKLPSVLFDFFTFDKEHKIGILPTAFVEFGFLPSVGFYFFWDDAVVKKNEIRIHGSTWGPEWLSIGVTDRVRIGKDSTVAMRTEWSRRQDYVFYGLGPMTLTDDQARYAADKFDAGPVFDLKVTDHVRYKAAVGVRDVRFRDGTCCGNPSVATRFAQGTFAAPPGFEDGYALGYERAEVALDSRGDGKTTQTGVRVVVDAEHATDVLAPRASSWVRYGATVGGFWDVTHARVLGLTVTTQLADPLQGQDIPFTEQVVLGGTGAMRGFRPGRLVGRSAAVATLSYEWPIWVWLDGAMHVAVGNVFDGQLRGIEMGKMRLSSGIGLRTSGRPDHRFEILAGFGTETFDQGASLSSFRLAFGATRGF